MFCPNCGSDNENGVAFCNNCGSKLTNGNQQSGLSSAGAVAKTAVATAKTKKIIAVIAIVLCAVIAVSIGSSVASRSPEEVLKQFGKASVKADIDSLFDCYVPNYKKLFKMAVSLYNENSDSTSESRFDSVDDLFDYMQESLDDAKESLEEDFGSNLKFTFDIKDTRKYSKRQLKNYKEDIADEIESFEDHLEFLTDAENVDVSKIFDVKKIKAVCCITADAIMEGNLEEETEEDMEIILIKFGSKWYIYEMAGKNMFTSVF